MILPEDTWDNEKRSEYEWKWLTGGARSALYRTATLGWVYIIQ